MSNALFKVPHPANEPVLNYKPGSPERAELKLALTNAVNSSVTIPMFIGGDEVDSKNKIRIAQPHDHQYALGYYYAGDKEHVKKAINSALTSKKDWANLPWEHRASIFLKAADLLTGPYRQQANAATMLGQSKNAFQSEIDAVCELADFWRYNVAFMTEIYSQQPNSSAGMWNRMEHRPLEGFTFALTPFNFTSIAGNLPTSMALMGNTVVWKTSKTQIYSAWTIVKILREAGLPDGVINLVHVSGPTAGEVIFNHPDFAGIHYTGSTEVFQNIWKTIGNNIHKYKTYPRIVGETGGKDFVVAHSSANPEQVATALSRGAFEYQGQKCSAASRAYIPSNLWKSVSTRLQSDLASMKMGSPVDFRNFINAVIDESSFDKIADYIENAKKAKGVKIIAGGKCDKSVGYFIEPTVLIVKDPYYSTMCEEIFGPVLTIYVYPENEFEKTLKIVDSTSNYALTVMPLI